MSAKPFLVSLSLILLTGCPVIPPPLSILSDDETPTEPSADSTLVKGSKFCKDDFWEMAVVPDLAEIEDPNQQCEFGGQGERLKTRLIHEAVDATPRVFRAFLEKGPSLDARTSSGHTALLFALVNGHTESVRALLEAGADVDLQDREQTTALMHASFQGHTEIVKALLEAGADVDLQDREQTTALIEASFRGYTEIVKALLDAGADQHIENNSGMTTMDWARRNGHAEIIGLLREAFLQDRSGGGR